MALLPRQHVTGPRECVSVPCADEAAIATELMGLVGLLWFHYGLLLELACYGLWTYRRWGPSLAKIMAVVNVIGSLIGLVAALCDARSDCRHFGGVSHLGRHSVLSLREFQSFGARAASIFPCPPG